ncbi:MAG: SH3 domain-containing protein [Alphaproteobacteria bacterium]|nr:SH3 domain-containing protein [Alphaproteobacteria bacterium]
MAQRATASFGTKEPETLAFASVTAADIIRAPSVERRIPVDFRALLKPHKKAGRLRLRIERLPQCAKLSAGQRGEDNSWSLASDELEDLHFLASSNVARDYEITVRVMTLEDGEISTLMVVPFVISACDETVSVEACRNPHDQDPVIRNQLSEMNSLFAVREGELLELRAALRHAVGERDAELAKARTDWELEVDRRVAEAVEQCRIHDRQEYEAREEAERKSLAAQEKLTAEKVTAEQKQTTAESERRSQAERQRWESESAARLKAARQEWEVEAGRGLKASHQVWQAESEKRIDEERRKWQAQAEGDAAKERDRWKSNAAQRLDGARQVWQAEADERAKADLESWKADADRRIKAERELWLAQSGEQTRTEFERSKAEIEARWEADTEALLAAERRRLAAEAEQRIAAEHARLAAEAELRIAAHQRLLSENAAAAKAESVREGANYPAAAASQVDHETVEKLAEERDKNRQFNKDLQAAADKNRELTAALAAMTLRCENAERAPVAAKSPPPVPDLGDGYIKSLRAEIATLHKSLANQAAELGRARAELEQARPLHIQRAPINLRIGALRDFQNEEEQAPGREKSKWPIRDCILVVAIVVPLVLFYPWIAVYLPQGVRDGIATATGGLLNVEIVQPVVTKNPLPPPTPVRPTAIASRVLKVHASPASKGAVIFSLPKNATVVVLEKQGNWSKIESPADDVGKSQQGWVWSASLLSKDR